MTHTQKAVGEKLDASVLPFVKTKDLQPEFKAAIPVMMTSHFYRSMWWENLAHLMLNVEGRDLDRMVLMGVTYKNFQKAVRDRCVAVARAQRNNGAKPGPAGRCYSTAEMKLIFAELVAEVRAQEDQLLK